MALQFAPPPTFGQPQSLVPDIKVQPVGRQTVPIRQLSQRDRQQEKDETKDYLLGLILGQAAPVIGDLAFKGASKIPGISGLLEDTVAEVKAPTRQSLAALAAAQGLDPIQTKALIDATMQQEAIRSSARPERQVPTKFGKAVQGIGGLLPAMAIKTPGGAKAFGQTYSSGLEAKAASQLSLAEAEQKIALERQKAISSQTGDYLGSQQQIKFFGLDPDTGKQISRNAIDVKGDRFVISQGTPYDVGADGNLVQKGQLYRNPILTSNTGTEARGAPVWRNYMSQDGKARLKLGYSQIIQTKDGGTRGATFIKGEGPNGTDLEVGPGNFWVIATSEAALKELKANLGKNEDEEAFWADRADQANNAATTFRGVATVVDILEKNPAALTVTGGAIPAALDTLEANIKGAELYFTNSKINDIFSSKNDDGDDVYKAEERARALRLNILAKKYSENPNDLKVEQEFLRVFAGFRENVNATYGAGPLGELAIFDGSSNQQAASARARVLAAQLRLAYQAAATAGQTGRTLSDKDLANFLQIVGYGVSQNPEIVKEQLYQFAGGVLDDFDGNPTVYNWVTNPDEFARYLRVDLGIDSELMQSALEEDGEAARTQLLDKIQESVGPAGGQFFKFEQKEDGTYEIILKDFESYIGSQGVIGDVLRDTKEFRTRGSSKSKTPTGTGAATGVLFEKKPDVRVGI
jgi:hypothetical protein